MTWKADGAHKLKTDFNRNRREGDRTNVSAGLSDKRSENLPQTLLSPDKQFNVPFDISQNGDFLIAAIYNKSEILFRSRQFAVVDLKYQKIVRIIDAEHSIGSLAWAPDGKYFAALSEQDVTKQVFKGPLDWLAEHLGHGNYYGTFYLTIYKSDGTSVCTEQVATKLPNAMSYIDWNKQ
jgi:WD40 repeat protein